MRWTWKYPNKGIWFAWHPVLAFDSNHKLVWVWLENVEWENEDGLWDTYYIIEV